LNSNEHTVLVVDDEEGIRDFLKEILTLEGFSVHTFSDGREALKQAVTLKPDLVLLDLILPDLDGVAICEALRANEQTQKIPILIVTGSPSNKQIENSMTCGGDDFIAKPIDVPDMLIRIRTLLECRDIVDPMERLSTYAERVRERTEAAQRPASSDPQSRPV
jgi:DNA-binding response OmpR family regulator